MIDTPQLIQTARQEAAVIRITIPRAEMQHVMGPAIGELMAAVAAQGIAVTGALFAHHLAMSSATFDFELGVPVAAPVTPVGRVMRGELPAASVARTVYHGAYEGLFGAWGDFNTWMKANHHQGAPHLWECYVTGPESSSNPADWRTELNQPLLP